MPLQSLWIFALTRRITFAAMVGRAVCLAEIAPAGHPPNLFARAEETVRRRCGPDLP